eukprot:m.141691 g.141691  ORF g.141691 m.141691 type:complete len:144 (-) comp14858_c0_seq4:2538-2969(-)
MSNLASEALGAKVVFSTSYDPSHPPEAIIDGLESTYWMTTGSFPQEVIITFDSAIAIESIESKSFEVKTFQLLKSSTTQPSDFVELCKSDLQEDSGTIQYCKHAVNSTVLRHLKIIISSGHKDFVGLSELIVKGENAEIKPFR